MELEIEALISSCTPISSAPDAGAKSAFNAPFAPSVTVQPLIEETHAPSLFRNRSNRIRLLLFGRLPNMIGGFGTFLSREEITQWGALQSEPSVNSAVQGGAGSVIDRNLVINASLQNPIYRNDVSTVQPASIRALVLIRSF